MRPIYEIASDIRKDWKPVSPYAAPYLDAMDSLDKITDVFIFDSASSIIAYFLSNATTWKGENARRIKQELRDMIKQARML